MSAEEVKFTFSMDDQFSKKAKEAESSVSGLEKKLGGLVTVVAGAFSISAVANFGKAVIDSLKNYEYFHASLRTLLNGNMQMVSALESKLVQLAKTTPFSLTDVQSGTKQLLAYGFNAGSLIGNMKTLGDVASGVAAPLTDIIYLYGTLKTQGRAYTRDIMQFTSRGIPIIRELAKQFGVTESEVQKLVEAGKVGFPEIERAFKSMTSEGGQFFGMMDEQSKTIGGKLSNLGDSWEQLKVHIGQSQTGILAETINWASSMVAAIDKSVSRSNLILSSIGKRGGKSTSYTGGSESTQAQLESLADMVRSSIEAGSKEGGDPRKQIQFLSNLGKVQNERFLKEIKGITDENMLVNYYAPQQNNRLALIKEGIDQLTGVIGLNKSKDKEVKPNDLKPDAAALLKKESDKPKGNQYTQITINIDQMTGVENLTTQDNKMIPINIGEELIKLMVKAVEDSQIVAGARI